MAYSEAGNRENIFALKNDKRDPGNFSVRSTKLMINLVLQL